MTCIKEDEAVRSWASQAGRLKRTYCCVIRGTVQCFQLTCQCGMKASPTNWFDGWNLATSGSHNQDGAGKADGASCASAQADVWGPGCDAVSNTQNLQVAQSIGDWWGKTPQVCRCIKRFKSTDEVFSLLKAAQENPFQWNATFIEVLFTPEVYPGELNSGCAGKCSSSCHVILETEAAKQLCLVLSNFSIMDDGSV